AQTVCPSRGGLGDALFDGRQIGLAAILGIGAHNDVHACMDGAGDLHLRLDARAAESIEDDLLDPLPDFSAVAIARNVDEAGIEPVERVAASEQAHGAPLVEIDDSAHDADEVVHVRLEQLVSWISLEDVEHRFAIVAVRIEPEVLDDSLDLAAQDGNVARTAVVDARSPQSQEPMLAGDAAAAVE